MPSKGILNTCFSVDGTCLLPLATQFLSLRLFDRPLRPAVATTSAPSQALEIVSALLAEALLPILITCFQFGESGRRLALPRLGI